MLLSGQQILQAPNTLVIPACIAGVQRLSASSVSISGESVTPKSSAETEQWGRVLEFREKFPKEGMWWPYRGKAQFEKLVRSYLTKLPPRGYLVSSIEMTNLR